MGIQDKHWSLSTVFSRMEVCHTVVLFQFWGPLYDIFPMAAMICLPMNNVQDVFFSVSVQTLVVIHAHSIPPAVGDFSRGLLCTSTWLVVLGTFRIPVDYLHIFTIMSICPFCLFLSVTTFVLYCIL